MASKSQMFSKNPRELDNSEAKAGVLMSFETKLVGFEGHRIEISIPTGALADYMFENGKVASC